MLQKFLVLRLLIATNIVIAMDDPTNYKIPAVLSSQSNKTIVEPTNSASKTALSSWTDDDKSNLIKILLEDSPINPDTGNTPLHYAAAIHEVPDLVTLMLQRKPELKNLIDHCNKQGFSPYILALLKNNTAGAQILKELGAKLDWPKKMYLPDSQKTISIEQP